MTRRKRIVREDDGTPVETDEDALALPSPDAPQHRDPEREVEITPAGAEAQCWSEHGMHDEAGVIIKTKYADIFVQRGWARDIQ
jgi:hypothetical protein